MQQRVLALVFVLFVQALPLSAASDWPQFTGPFGTTAHGASNPLLLDDLTQARLLWESEIRELPASKLYVQNKLPVPSGGMQDIIKVGDTIIYAHMWPSGEDLAGEKAGSGGCELDRKLVCDDVIVAIDATTGATKWRRVYEQQGLYSPPTKRGGYGIYPASDGEKVYWLGSGGMLYALAVADGSEVWQVKAEPFYSLAEQRRAASLQNGRRVSDDMLSSLTVVGDTVVVPMFTKSAKREPGHDLAGFDRATGEQRWLLPGVLGRNTTPVVWRDADSKPFILVANGYPGIPGHLRLIDPASGAIVWEQPTAMPQVRQLAVNNDMVYLASQASDLTGKKGPTAAHTFAAWRLSSGGAELVWTMPDEPAYRFPIPGDSQYMAKVMPAGEVFYISRLVNSDSGRSITVQEHDSATGKILRSVGGFPGCWATVVWPVNDSQLILSGDTEHWHLGYPDFTVINRQTMQATGQRWMPGKGQGPGGKMKHWSVTAYEVPMSYFISNGLLYLRGIGGPGLRCFDLRAPQVDESNGGQQ